MTNNNSKKFNSIVYSKDFIINDIERIRISKLIKLIGINKKVLDLGCRDGQISQLIAKNNNVVYGIEIANEMVKKCNKKGIKVFDIDLNSNWQESIEKKFDIVLAGEIIEHIFDTDKFLQNIYKILKSDGFLVLSTPNIASFGRRILLLLGKNPLIETTSRKYDAGHIRYFTLKALKLLLKENNFKVINFESDCINFDRWGQYNFNFLTPPLH